jgi:hypothetical protein
VTGETALADLAYKYRYKVECTNAPCGIGETLEAGVLYTMSRDGYQPLKVFVLLTDREKPADGYTWSTLLGKLRDSMATAKMVAP